MREKLQVPSSKLQRSSKDQIPNTGPRLSLKVGAFTLIELLVVIAVIALLAALLIPIVQASARQRVLRRASAELAQIETAIEEYKAARGFYPPDSPQNPAINQLYYELLGTKATPTTYTTLDDSSSLPAAQIPVAFPMVDGFLNYSRVGANDETQAATTFLKGLKPAQIGEISITGVSAPVRVIVGAPWTDPTSSPVPGTSLNPWRYNSSSPANNPNSFDLWLDVLIGAKTHRISNWSGKATAAL